MPANSDPVSLDSILAKINAKLALMRANAQAPASWLKRTFPSPAELSRQNDFNAAVADALEEAVAAVRELAASQQVRFENLERDLAELRSVLANVRDLQERSTAIEAQLAQVRQEQGELRERSVTAETQLTQLSQLAQLAQWREEQVEKISQLAAGQGELGGELRERIQHVLDEQRVCLRQLALKTSEEAVLADRARRATELRLEELARRLPERPA
jgi:type I site-specific restriction endonuclease